MIPVRCFTCNAVVADLWQPYSMNKAGYLEQGLSEIEATNKALDDVGLEDKRQYCCRRMLLGHVDITERLLQYTPREKQASLTAKKKKATVAAAVPENSDVEEPIPEDDNEPDESDDENVYDRPVFGGGEDYDNYGGEEDYEEY
jgi:DNA-directed RNA polymerases I, II, and III subunit RPABC5